MEKATCFCIAQWIFPSIFFIQIFKQPSSSLRAVFKQSSSSLRAVFEQSLSSLRAVFEQSSSSLRAVFEQSLSSLWAVFEQSSSSLRTVFEQSSNSLRTVKGHDQKRRQDTKHLTKCLISAAEHYLSTSRETGELYSESYEKVAVLFASMPNFMESFKDEDNLQLGLKRLKTLNEIIRSLDMVSDHLMPGCCWILIHAPLI